MRSISRWIACLLLLCAPVLAEPPRDQSYYLPEEVTYDEKVPTPRSVLGYEVGEWHVRHDQLVEYYRELAQASPRVTLERYDWTHEVPKRKSEPVKQGAKYPRRDRGRRVSLTFRKVLHGN